VTCVNTTSGCLQINGPTLTADEASKELFEAADSGTLLLRWCSACGGWAAPVTGSCPYCHRHDLVWRPAAGVGELVTWTVVHSLPHPAFAGDMPIISAIVEFIEGPWLNLRLIGSISDLCVGAKVEVRFAHSDNGASYPIALLPVDEALS
jgi:uncharacterized OB-fold protein